MWIDHAMGYIFWTATVLIAILFALVLFVSAWFLIALVPLWWLWFQFICNHTTENNNGFDYGQ